MGHPGSRCDVFPDVMFLVESRTPYVMGPALGGMERDTSRGCLSLMQFMGRILQHCGGVVCACQYVFWTFTVFG